MLDDVLREGFRLTHRRFGLVFLDFLWKAVWFVFTVGLLFLVAAWFGARFEAIGRLDTGNRGIDTAVGLALLRQFWSVNRTQIVAAAATVVFVSIVMWLVLEALFRRRLISGRFSTFLLSNLLKSLFLTNAALGWAAIFFSRPDRGAAFIVIVTLTALAFLLTIIETLVRTDALELLGTDLFRVAGLIGILLLFEAMISGSCAIMLTVGFLKISGWREALVMVATAAAGGIFMTVLHSYLLVVRFSAISLMRQNVVQV